MEELLKNQIFAIHALSGVGSVALGTALTYPLDTIKTLIQVGSGSSKQLTTTQVLKRVRYFSGNSGLYNGFLWLAAGRTLGLVARFGTYEILTVFYKDGREDNYVYVSEALLAGLVAGVAESLISSPLELTKLRAQVTSASCFPNSAPLLEKGAVAPVIQRLLRGCSLDMKALNSSVALLSTLTTKHPNMKSALQLTRVPMDDNRFWEATLSVQYQETICNHLFGRMGCIMGRSTARSCSRFSFWWHILFYLAISAPCNA